MKKVFLLAVATFLTFAFSNAQGISYGLKAGLNLSNWHTSVSEMNDALDMRTSFNAGFVVEIPVSDQFSVQPELLYSSLGTKMSAESMGRASNDYVIASDYLSIPVMAKYYATEGLSFEVGPQLGILLSAKEKYDGDSMDVKDALESIDFGAGVGAGYKLENGLFFNARYVLGLTNIMKEATGDDFVKNNVFQFSLGYMFK